MTPDEFSKLFEYKQNMRSDLSDQILDVSSDIDGLRNKLDGIADLTTADDLERAALSVQVDRHEEWIERVSPKLGLKYDPSAPA